ncbi:hypothetical protein V2O64_18580 [Verrucomicrobiaceae bacterium 227]
MGKKPVIVTFLIILGLLCYGGYRVKRMQDRNASYSNSMSAMRTLHIACMDYYHEYSQLPPGDLSDTDTIRVTTGSGDNNIMPALCGRLPQTESQKEGNFFIGRETKDRKNGLLRNESGTKAELFDPWGHPYYVLLDYDDDGQLLHPQTNEIIPDVKILIWSPGPDRRSDTPESSKDDIYFGP